jgi:hypothetical protein
MNELELVERFDKMNKVVEEMLKGSSPTQIAKQLSMSRTQVIELTDEWKNIIHNDSNIRARAREALAGADQHFAMIISKAWETVEQADANSQYNTKAQALKLIADVESKRLDMLNKAGVLEDNGLANQILETEKKQKIIVDLLREVTATCNSCKQEVARRISQITGQVEAIRID